jgi:Tfp pilus assembly protein PilO
MKIRNREQVLMVIVLALIVLWAGNLAVYGPMSRWWLARQDKIKELRQDVSQGKSLIRREAYLRSQWADMRTNSLPNDSSLAEQQVLRSLNNWVGSSGVNVSSVTPQWEMEQTNYSTLDCRVEATGDLGTLSRFLYEIENDPTAFQLASVDLNANDDRGQQLTLGIEISGLALISPQP